MCWFVPYFTILYHENHWFHLKKLQDSHHGAFLVIFGGRFCEPQGSPSWISFDKSQEFLHGFTTGNAYLGFCEVSLARARNLSCWAFDRDEVVTCFNNHVFGEKTKMLSKTPFFQRIIYSEANPSTFWLS